MEKLIQPVQRDAKFLADVLAHLHDPGFRLWWLGQSGFLLQWADRHVLFDPYLSDSLTKKYADTDKPHVRMTERVIDPAELEIVDIATSSHNHTDHLDGETLTALMNANPDLRIIVPEANRQFAAERLKVNPDWFIGADVDRPIEIEGFTFHAVPAAHDELKTDEQGRHHFVGYVVRFGGFGVYHSGDTLLYDGMIERLRAFAIDVALLPINGRKAERRVAGNLWGREAAKLAHDIGAQAVVPCHYDMFTFNTETPDEFIAECERIGQPYRVLQCGQRLDMPPR